MKTNKLVKAVTGSSILTWAELERNPAAQEMIRRLNAECLPTPRDDKARQNCNQDQDSKIQQL